MYIYIYINIYAANVQVRANWWLTKKKSVLEDGSMALPRSARIWWVSKSWGYPIAGWFWLWKIPCING